LSGTQAICVGGASIFSSTVTGGTWTSSATSVATINSSTGAISGVSAGTATLTYTVAGTGGCANATATRVVTVTAAPSAGTLSGTQAICVGGTSTFSSTVAGGSWNSSDINITTVDASTGVIAGIIAGTATMTYTVAGTGGCANATATRVVTVTAPPSAGTLSGTQAICVGGASTFSSTVTGGTWTSSAISVATINSSTGAISGVSAGTATMTYTVAGTGGCADVVATRTIAVTAPPSAGILSGIQTICVGGTSTLSSTVNGGSWSSSNNSVASINGFGLVTGITTGTATMTYTVAGAGGCADATATRLITINPLPIATIAAGSSTTFCSGESVILTASSGTGYLWSNGQTTQSITVSSSGSYFVTVTNSNGCAATSVSTNVTVNPKPTVIFSVNNANQCVNSNSYSFTNNSSVTSGVLNYQWIFGDGNTSTVENPTHSYISPGSYTVKLIVTSALGCKDSTTRTINVFEKPSPGFSINAAVQCVNDNSFLFTNTTTIGNGTLTYVWNFGDGNSTNTQNSIYSYSSPGTYLVKLVAISNNGCADSITQSVTVNPKPAVNFSINTGNQCLINNQYIFANLSSISAGILTHSWDFGDGNNSVQPSATHSYTAAGTYAVKLVSVSELGCRDSIIRSVTVYPMPTGTLVTPSTNLLCEGGNVQLTATGGTSYQWFLNGGAITGATNATHSATQPGTYTVNLISLNSCTAQATGTVTLQLVQKPTANFSYDKYCAGFPTQFNDQSNVVNSNMVTYSWTFGAGQSTSTLQNPSYVFPTASTYSVSLVVTPVACASLATTITKTVSIVAPPINQRYISLNAVQGRNLQLEARTFGGATYNWSPASGLNNPSISTPVFNYNAEVDFVISITTGAGCVIKDSQLVRIFKEKEIYMPKGFSPNSDGNNDKIFPRLVGVRSLSYFKVYNRWGQLIFQTSKDGEGWDGTFRGSKQPMESYVWIAEGIDIDNNPIKRTGTFLLLR
jgi:gliding motility-associated-like protein